MAAVSTGSRQVMRAIQGHQDYITVIISNALLFSEVCVCLLFILSSRVQITDSSLQFPLHPAHSCFLYVKEDCKQNQILISRGRFLEFWWNGMIVFLFMTKERSMGLEGLVGTNCQIICVSFSLKTTQPSFVRMAWNPWSILRWESKCTIGAQKRGVWDPLIVCKLWGIHTADDFSSHLAAISAVQSIISISVFTYTCLKEG